MPRPCKRRRICTVPSTERFGPIESADRPAQVIMTLDEYESIRLIDHQGLTQEQCAGSMLISRSTVQAIYDNARKKVAECLVNSKELVISGGDYILCDGGEKCHCAHCGKRHRGQHRE